MNGIFGKNQILFTNNIKVKFAKNLFTAIKLYLTFMK